MKRRRGFIANHTVTLCQNSLRIAFLLPFSLVSLWIQIHTRMGYRFFCLFLVLLALSLEPQNLKSWELTCNPNDLRALAGFSNCLESAIAGWNRTVSPDCCTWTGITCDNSTFSGRRVVGLELGSKVNYHGLKKNCGDET